jgi:hypothetical protein
MGADFLVSVLEIEKGVEPNLVHAGDFIQSLTSAQLLTLGKKLEDNGLIGDDFDADGVRERLLRAHATVCDSWAGALRSTAVLTLAHTRILVAGNMSWGDPVEECDDFSVYALCGAGHVAGFLECDTFSS